MTAPPLGSLWWRLDIWGNGMNMAKSNADIAREIIEHRLKISRERNLPKEKGITMLDCPYSDKDRVKGLGAKWNGTLKRWYITEKMDKELFKQWIRGSR